MTTAQLVTGTDRYVGRLIRLRGTDDWVFLAFDNLNADGGFIGTIGDPLPVSWDGAHLRLGPGSTEDLGPSGEALPHNSLHPVERTSPP